MFNLFYLYVYLVMFSNKIFIRKFNIFGVNKIEC